MGFNILLVEDNTADQHITREGLKEIGARCALSVISDGAEAVDYLLQRGSFRTAPRPHLVILDLNLPKMHGTEILRILRSHSALKSVPVVILTSSRSQQDIAEAYENGANAYAIKPPDVLEYFSLIQAIHDFWLRVERPAVSA